MKRVHLMATVVLLSYSSAASADWNGPGWYVTVSFGMFGEYVWTGPYSEQDACRKDANAFTHRSSAAYLFSCQRLDDSKQVYDINDEGRKEVEAALSSN